MMLGPNAGGQPRAQHGPAGKQQDAWQKVVRELAAAGRIPQAMEIVEQRLRAVPEDTEARGWRARLLAWSGRWPEAESEYRRALAGSPQDADLLCGLADVLIWQGRNAEALAEVERARAAAPEREDIEDRRRRVLEALRPEPRHQVVVASEWDFFDTTSAAGTYSVRLRSRVSSRWTTVAGGSFLNRFGERAARFTASATYRVGETSWITAGGAAGRDQGVIAKGESFFEYGRGLRLKSNSVVRGVEATYRQHWLWFREARVLALTPSALFYLPRDWTFQLGLTAARTRLPGAGAEWRPSGQARLAIPVTRRLRGTLFFAAGTENFSRADQVEQFSARTWGGGAQYELGPRQDITFSIAQQQRSQSRRQTTFGIAYGIRF